MIKAPQIVGNIWLNTPRPLTPEEFDGRIVLYDFFTFSCVNCLKTIPYLERWWSKYKHLPFFIIGIHTPEFEFEKSRLKVKTALDNLGITWPVILDNEYINWQNFANHYWPAKYLANGNGRIIYEHYGEGNYEETEREIQRVLYSLGEKNLPPIEKTDFTKGGYCSPATPELYCGYLRGKLANKGGYHSDHLGNYKFPIEFPKNTIALSGEFNATAEYVESFACDSALAVNFEGTEVNLVFEPAFDELAVAEVKFNGQTIPAEISGQDVDDGDIILTESRMYNLLRSSQSKTGILSIRAKKAISKRTLLLFPDVSVEVKIMDQILVKKVFNQISKIPIGKVATYGQIAKIVGTGPRVIGNILHKNTDPIKYPCHRVVNRRGEVSSSYAFGGSVLQMEKLINEGVIFKNKKIDLYTCQVDL